MRISDSRVVKEKFSTHISRGNYRNFLSAVNGLVYERITQLVYDLLAEAGILDRALGIN